MPSSNDQQLVTDFVLTFGRLDECMTYEGDPYPSRYALATGEADEHGFRHWEPIRVDTNRSYLENIYAKLPGRFPRLYEQLVLAYRWAEVDLTRFTLLANPPGVDLEPLLQQIQADKHLSKVLEENGYVRFAKGPDIDYDPVCFDFRRRRQGGDCPVVKLDHEQILCNSRIRKVAELAPSFRDLVFTTIATARTLRTS
jgi:hypothetical protein